VDNVTHTLFGVALARAGLARKCGPGTTLVLALASNAPDVDGIWSRLVGGESFLIRRIATHALPVLPLWALVAALLLRPFVRRMPFLTLWLLCLLGMVGHTLLDLVNSYGVVLWWPFSRARHELALVFIIDLMFTAILLAPLLVTPWLRQAAARENWFRGALILLACYLGATAGLRARTFQQVAAASPIAAAAPERVRVFPEVLGAHRFRAVVLVPDESHYEAWLVHALAGRVERLPDVPTQARDPRVLRARTTPRAQDLLWMFAAPVWTLLPDGRQVQLHDLRFCSAVWPRGTPFARVLPLDP
jgi:inner membrane protein